MDVFRVWQPFMNFVVRWTDDLNSDEQDGSCPTEKLNKDHENGVNVDPVN